MTIQSTVQGVARRREPIGALFNRFHSLSMPATRACGAAIVSVAIASFTIAPSLASQQSAVSRQNVSRQKISLDSSVFRSGTLPNGLRYIVRRNTLPAGRAEMRLVVDAGSILEDDDQRGLAHFVEHMAFNGTKHFPRHRIIEYIESAGLRFGSDLNASTSFDETIYELKVPADPAVIDTALLIFEDWARNITFDPKEVEDERGVVMEERRLNQGPRLRQFLRHAPVLMGSRYGARFPIGAGEVLLQAPQQTLVRFYKDWYRPNLMTVIVVGDVDPAQIESRIRKRFSALVNPPNPRPRPVVQIPRRTTGVASIAEDDDIPTWSATLVFPMPDIDTIQTELAFRRQAMGQLLYAALNDRLSTLARTPESPIRRAAISRDLVGRSTLAHRIVVEADEPTTLELAIVLVRAELARLARHGLTEVEFERARRVLLEMGTRWKATSDAQMSEVLVNEYVKSALRRRPYVEKAEIAEWLLRFAPAIRPDELRALAAEIDSTSDWIVLADIPKSSEHGKPSYAVLLDAVQNGARHRLPPYQDTSDVRPLLAVEPSPGRIIKERTVADVGVTEWTFSNGARVLLKPTSWERDALTIRAVAPGGISLATDDEYLSAAVASDLVSRSGYGPFTRKALGRRLTGLVSGSRVTIDRDKQEIVVSGTPRHQSTMLQLLHLMFTSPRIDEEPFSKWRRQARLGSMDPFELAFLRASTQRHPWARPVNGAAADSVDSTAALRFYRQRFGDAGDFTFVVIGDFEIDSLRPLIERYIGSLSGTGPHAPPRVRDHGIRPPAGVVNPVVVGGDSIAETWFGFSNIGPPRPHTHLALQVLKKVLDGRTFQRLREELSGIYSAGVRARSTLVSAERQDIDVRFSSKPERADELQRAFLAIVDTLVRDGVSERDIRSAQTILRREREMDVQSNRYWMTQLSEVATSGRSLDEILAQHREPIAVTPAMVNEEIRAILDRSRYILAVSLPVRMAPAQRDELLLKNW